MKLTNKLARLQGRALQLNNRAQGDSVNALVVIGASLFIGVFVLAQIGSAMPTDAEGNIDLPMFSSAFDSVTSILSSSIELAAILPIVIIAAGLLFYVRRFSGGSGARR
jgi:hypothetical protein